MELPTPTPAAPAAASPAPAASPPTQTPAASAPIQSSPSGAGASGTPAPGLTPPAPAGSPTPGLNPALAPAAAQPAPGQPAAAPAPSFDDQFRQRYGMDPSQAQMLIHMGYQSYQGRQGQPAAAPPGAPAQPAQPNVFGLPQFDMNLLNFVGRDDLGRLQALPGAPPDAVIRVQEYQEKLRQVQQQFWANPQQFLMPMIEQRARQIAAEEYQGRHQQTQAEQFAAQTLQQNASWLFEKTPQGQTQYQFNPATGQNQPVLSQVGRYYRDLVGDAHRRGVADPAMQHDYAVKTIQNHLLQQQLAQLQAPQAQANANQTFLNTAQPAAPAPTVQPNLPAAQPGQTLKQVMAQRFANNGLTDEEVQRQLGRTSAA